MQVETANEDNQADNVSCQSSDSNSSVSHNLKEKLDLLINMELKHSGVYYDLSSKNKLLKVDLENVDNSCQRLEKQAKKKSELLEESYEKLMDHQKKSKELLQEKMNLTLSEIDKVNNLFSTSFKNYDPVHLKNSVQRLDNETERMKKEIEKNTNVYNNIYRKGEIYESLMKPKHTQLSNIDIVTNILSERLLKRPEIKLEETVMKLSKELKNLVLKQQHILSANGKK